MKKIIIILILILASILRLWNLDTFPALNADEASIGYDAYSLIRTGKDQHGNSWPIHFQSFNDYKPGLYTYLVLPLVKVFGLNAWSVRLPSAFLGIATIYLVYLLIQKLEIGNWKLEILAPALLAISPWHIHYSRGGWEVNVATFFMVLGTVLFLKGRNNIVHLFLSAFVFSLSLYTYHASRIVSPLLVIGLLAIYREEVRKNITNFLLAGLLGLVAVLPLIKDFTNPAISSRAAGVGILSDRGPIDRINEQRGEHVNLESLPAVSLHNKAVNYGLAFLENWSDHYHGQFLFLSGDDIQRNKVPETGQMYMLDLAFIFIGMFGMIKVIRRKSSVKKTWKLVMWWLVMAPVTASLTFQSPHALRAQNMIIPLTIISAYGLYVLIVWLNENITSRSLLATCYLLLATILFWNFARYEHMYWVHMAKEYPFSSQYGVEELVEYLNRNGDKYERIVVTTRYDQPYMLFLYYLKYPPKNFQNEHELTDRDQFGFSTVERFDRYVFKEIDFDNDAKNYPNSLIIGTDEEIPQNAKVIKEIYGNNKYMYFQIVDNQ